MNTAQSFPSGSLASGDASFLHRLLPLLAEVPEPQVVGGFLRDSLLGRRSFDLDITVAADAVALARSMASALGGTWVLLDEPRSIARVVVQHQGQVWHVDVTSQRGELREDLAQRDFTINAMSVPLSALLAGEWRERVFDPWGGIQDLSSRLVRAVKPEVFQEDGLRLLRAVRLAASLDFHIDAETQELMGANASALSNVSWERIRDEFLAILAAPRARQWVYLLDDLGLLCRVVPELEDGRGVTQPREHYWDVLRHNMETVGAVEGLLERRWEPSWVLESVPWSEALALHFQEMAGDAHTRGTLLRLAGLLHDVAKPATRTVDPRGRIRFLGHHTDGAMVAGTVLQRLRLSRRSTGMIVAAIEHHLRPGQMSQGAEMATPRAVYKYFRNAGDVAVDTLYLNLADYVAARGPLLEQEEWVAYARQVSYILETGLAQDNRPAKPSLVDGHALMSYLGLPPGPVIGRLLEAVREGQATGQVATREEAMALARKVLAGELVKESHA